MAGKVSEATLICLAGYAVAAMAALGTSYGWPEFFVAGVGVFVLGLYCAKLDAEGR